MTDTTPTADGRPRPGALRLYYDPPGTLRLTVAGDRSYPGVKLYQAWPLSEPGRHLSLLDSKGEEIVMLPDLDGLSPESRAVAEEELRRRYLTARVERVLGIRTEFGVTYWDVETHRGRRDFVLTSISESCQWLGPDHLLIIDVGGNRYEFPNLEALDGRSRALLDTVL